MATKGMGETSFWQLGSLRESEAGQRAQRVSSHHSHPVQHESPHTQPGESCRLTDTLRTGWGIAGHRRLERGPGRSKRLLGQSLNEVPSADVGLFQ